LNSDMIYNLVLICLCSSLHALPTPEADEVAALAEPAIPPASVDPAKPAVVPETVDPTDPADPAAHAPTETTDETLAVDPALENNQPEASLNNGQQLLGVNGYNSNANGPPPIQDLNGQQFFGTNGPLPDFTGQQPFGENGFNGNPNGPPPIQDWNGQQSFGANGLLPDFTGQQPFVQNVYNSNGNGPLPNQDLNGQQPFVQTGYNNYLNGQLASPPYNVNGETRPDFAGYKPVDPALENYLEAFYSNSQQLYGTPFNSGYKNPDLTAQQPYGPTGYNNYLNGQLASPPYNFNGNARPVDFGGYKPVNQALENYPEAFYSNGQQLYGTQFNGGYKNPAFGNPMDSRNPIYSPNY